jgi:hypothetical protein
LTRPDSVCASAPVSWTMSATMALLFWWSALNRGRIERPQHAMVTCCGLSAPENETRSCPRDVVLITLTQMFPPPDGSSLLAVWPVAPFQPHEMGSL